MPPPRILPALEPGERGRFYLTSLAFVCVATSALVARALGDALFLSRLGSDALPLVYVGGAIATGLGAYACALAAGRVSTARVGTIVAGLFAAAYLLVYAALDLFPTASRVGAYLLADLSGRLPVLLFWALASETFDARESRRLFGLLGAAGTAACLPTGLLVGPLAARFGTEPLILAVGVLMAGFILAVRALERRKEAAVEAWRRGRRTLVAANARSLGFLHGNRLSVAIALLAAGTAIVQTLVDYQFKATFAPLASSAALARVFGNLYALSSLAALLIQVFLMHRILQWAGVLGSLWLLPAALLAASAGTAATGAPVWAFATKALDVTLTLTVYGTARQMLYRGIRSESRLQARALAEGIYQPLAVSAAGSALALSIGAVSVRGAAAAALAGCAACLVLCWWAYAAYVSGLLDSIRARWFEPSDDVVAARTPAFDAYVRRTLGSAPDEEVIYLAAVLPQLGDFAGAPELRAALRRGNTRVRVALLDALRVGAAPAADPAVLDLAGHEDPEVRRAAVRCAGGAGGGAAWLEGRLADPDPRVRAAAAAGLINLGSAPPAFEGMRALEEMAGSAPAEVRAAAAEALGDVREASVTPLLARLLEGTEESVLAAALDACRRHPDAALAPRLLQLLASPLLSSPAAEALAAAGAAALPALTAALERSAGPPQDPSARRIPAVLARIGDAAALPPLRSLLGRLGPEDRTPAVEAYSLLARRRPPAAAHHRDLESLILGEIREAADRQRTHQDLAGAAGAAVLRGALADLVRCHLRHAFILLEARVRDVDMKVLYASLMNASKESRSQAIELLENVLPETVRQPLLDVLERAGPPAEDGRADPLAAVPPLLRRPPSEWIAAGAAHAASEMGLRSCACDVRALLGHPSPVVRETALAALSRLEDRAAFLQACLPLTSDPDEAVRRLAAALSGAGVGAG